MHFLLDAEELGEKILEMRPDRDQQLGFGLALERVGALARRAKRKILPPKQGFGQAHCI